MEKILVPLGNSENSVDTLQYAIDFASVCKAKIYVIQVFGSVSSTGILKNVDELIEVEAKEELQTMLEQVDEKDVEVIAKVLKGQVTESVSVIAEALEVDLIISSANYSGSDHTVFIGPIVGSIVKRTQLPILIIPKGYVFQPIHSVLLGVRSGLMRRPDVLVPLKGFVSIFDAKINLLHVITPKNTEEDNVLHADFEAIGDDKITTKNETVYEGLSAHINTIQPDLLCVIRRKRGFFSKMWEQNSIKKVDFESKIPLLVLKGNL